ncbi:hypothetical protein EST38_g6060 [Candolleomyces aberdarensis]|uniref:Uncharacterized protein n=1 Tax=Candolleomyces aberdarensis TaxID=2316362 RepID=A0A4Q2DIX0_9AGAR|nr:hypothetical protein EST38_g6060 [Candolleomyces aberdarensis]
MDEFYNKCNAGETLGRIIEGREPAAEATARDLHLATSEIGRYTVHSFNQPRAWRLCMDGGSGEGLEEACFRVQGVLCGKDLPPVILNGARKFIRQSVKITGFGNEDMLQCIKQIEAVYLKMSNQFKEGSLEPWQPSIFEENAALDASTRYFTPANHSTAGDTVDFAPHVDPDGRLRDLMETEYVHTTDNRVDYMELVTSPNGARTYKVIDPVAFKYGDIVEATISFAAIPTKNNAAKMHVLLRALVLLDQTERNTAAILRMRQRYKTINFGTVLRSVAQPVLKRKVAYYNEETDTEDTNRRLSRMRVDSDSD